MELGFAFKLLLAFVWYKKIGKCRKGFENSTNDVTSNIIHRRSQGVNHKVKHAPSTNLAHRIRMNT